MYVYLNKEPQQTGYDILGRATNATDSIAVAREWLYNSRSELAAAAMGPNLYGYDYDSIGNRLWSAENAATNTYAANCLNQYTSISNLCASVSPCELSYDADGNLLSDGVFIYAYDAGNRLLSVTSATLTNGAIRVVNAYDHRGRRIRKTVQRLHSTMSPPPSPPTGTQEWQTIETRTFAWDGNNIVLETKTAFNSPTLPPSHSQTEYFWGNDKSGTEQGAGGVGGLLAVSVDGVFYIPCYDHNGNIVRYVSETGAVAVQYLYDPYGNMVEASGPLADQFSFGFSTKYHDRETGLVAYQQRFYHPPNGRWLNRDPIEEEGGLNLYAFCQNNPALYYDANGCWAFIDNAIAAIGGALVGVACQAISDVMRGEASGWESYVGSAVAGVAMGEILLHNPAMAGATKVMYSGMAVAAGNFVKQVCSVEISKKQESYNTQEIVVDFVAGAAFSMIPVPGIDGINKGQGSYLSIARSMNKKFINGSISRVSMSTTVKSFVGTSVEYGTTYGAAQPYVSDKINQGIDYLGDLTTPVYSGVQIFYSETLFIRATDKCGNVVDLYYSREVSNE